MTIKIRGLPASFGISKPIAGRTTTAFAGDPTRGQSRTVGPSTAPRTSAVAQGSSTAPSQVVLRRAGSQPAHLLGGTDKNCVKEKCSFKSK